MMVLTRFVSASAQDDKPEICLLDVSDVESEMEARSESQSNASPSSASHSNVLAWRWPVLILVGVTFGGLLFASVVVGSASSVKLQSSTVVNVKFAEELAAYNETVCTAISTLGACRVLLNFNHVWNTANADLCQQAMDAYTTDDVGVELALSKTSYILIYHDNVGYRFGQYISSGEFNFDTDPSTHWTVRQQTVDEVTAFRPMTMFMNVGWFKMHAMFIVLRTRPEPFPDSTANDVENCPDGCRANVWVRMKKQNGAWAIREVSVIKLE